TRRVWRDLHRIHPALPPTGLTAPAAFGTLVVAGCTGPCQGRPGTRGHRATGTLAAHYHGETWMKVTFALLGLLLAFGPAHAADEAFELQAVGTLEVAPDGSV